MNFQKNLRFCLTACAVLFVAACSNGPEILFIKIDWGVEDDYNDHDDGFQAYSFKTNQPRRIGHFYNQRHSGFGNFAIACGALVPAQYTTIVNRSRTEFVSFKIKQEVWGNDEGNGGPMHRVKINYPSYILQPGQTLTMNDINSCYDLLNRPFGVRSKFQHSLDSATVTASGSEAYIQDLKSQNKDFTVTEDSSCESYCSDDDNYCLQMPFDTLGQQQAVNKALADFNTLFDGDIVDILEVQKTLHIEQTDCTISDLVAVEGGFEANGNRCSFKTKGSDLTDVSGRFPDVFKLGVTNDFNKSTYTLSPSVYVLFEGGNDDITDGFNSKFAAGLSSIEITPSKIFVGSGPECLIVNIK
jgi:hypothetical protein